MHNGNLANWQGSGGLARTDGLGRLEMLLLGLGIWDFGGDGPGKHCCLWEFCCCWAGG